MTFSILEDINKIGNGLVSYYDVEENDFVSFDCLFDEPDEDRFIKLPYVEDCKRVTWKLFWESLNDEERELAESFNEKHVFLYSLMKPV